jgi:hypothetical protein
LCVSAVFVFLCCTRELKHTYCHWEFPRIKYLYMPNLTPLCLNLKFRNMCICDNFMKENVSFLKAWLAGWASTLDLVAGLVGLAGRVPDLSRRTSRTFVLRAEIRQVPQNRCLKSGSSLMAENSPTRTPDISKHEPGKFRPSALVQPEHTIRKHRIRNVSF